MRFYTSFTTQIEVLPRLTIIYGSLQFCNREIMRGVGIEWLWFGVFIGAERHASPARRPAHDN